MFDLIPNVPDPQQNLVDKPGTDGKYMPIGTAEGVKYRKILTPDDIRKQEKLNTAAPGKLILPKDDPRYAALTEQRICLHCASHNRELGGELMRDQKFIERLLHDEKYKTEWFNDFTKFGVCEPFSDQAGVRLVDGDAPAVCAASDVDTTKAPGSPAGQEQIPCPFWTEATTAGKLIATRHGVRGVGKRDQAAANAYIKQHQANKKLYDAVSGNNKR